MCTFELIMNRVDDDYDDVCYRIDERPKLEGETENMGLERRWVLLKIPRCLCTRESGGREGLMMMMFYKGREGQGRHKQGSEGPRETL